MTKRVVAAFVPLVDCAVLVAAKELRFAVAEGIELDLRKEPSWASLRDHLNLGYVDCAHALAPLPIASSLGVGHVHVDCAVPFVLGRGGNAITVSTSLYREMCSAVGGAVPFEPAAMGRALAMAAALRIKPLTLGMVFPFSSHNFDLRYWLAAAGVDPDRDVRLVSIPPPLMVESLAAGQVDGFCVGEPWNSLAVAKGIGRIVATKSQLFPGGVEKVLTVRPTLGALRDVLGPLLRALDAAAAWAEASANHAELASILGREEYVGAPAALIELALGGQLSLDAHDSVTDPDFMYFHRRAANVPRAEEALWIYAQMLRWGQMPPSAASESAARKVFRPDLYREYLPSQGDIAMPAAFDGIEFTPGDVAGYLDGFRIRTSFVPSPSVAEP